MNKQVEEYAGIVVGFAIFWFLFPCFTMLIWNKIAPSLDAPLMTYWTAFGLHVIAKLMVIITPSK